MSRKNESDKFEQKLEWFLSDAWCEIKKFMDKIVDWYWFPKDKTPGKKAWHLILWWMVTLAILRVLNFI